MLPGLWGCKPGLLASGWGALRTQVHMLVPELPLRAGTPGRVPALEGALMLSAVLLAGGRAKPATFAGLGRAGGVGRGVASASAASPCRTTT